MKDDRDTMSFISGRMNRDDEAQLSMKGEKERPLRRLMKSLRV
jgi:hypothetical protein